MKRVSQYMAVVFVVTIGACCTSVNRVVWAQSSNEPRYVALGDSFASGSLIPDQIDATCRRSNHNYATFVAQKLKLALTDVSCGAATIDDVLTTGQHGGAPQIAAVTPDTKYVTITIGNNDVLYSIGTIVCAATAAQGASCLGTRIDTGAIATRLAALESRLTETLQAIKRAAPSAKVFLVAYPRVLPATGKTCPPQNPLLSQDSLYLVGLGAQLQKSSLSAAKRARVAFVDSYTPKGHDICAPETQRWIEGAAPASITQIYHPNERGMRAQATMLVRAIRNAQPSRHRRS